MNFSLFESSNTNDVVRLFTQVFSESEGEKEGAIIGKLVSNLITRTEPQDLIGCIAVENSKLVGGIFFSRLRVPNNQAAFILSPVAILTDTQGEGIGQQLINYGLDHLRSLNVELAFTYGDPAYYCKTGFTQISEDIVKAPCPLSQPIGWLAQSLTDNPLQAMKGTTQCVDALSDPKYW